MNKEIIDIKDLDRMDTYNFFKSYSYPYLTVSVKADITEFYNYITSKHFSTYGSLCWIICYAANQISEFKLRYENNQIVRYDNIGASFSVLMKNNILNFSDFIEFSTLEEFIKKFEQIKNEAESNILQNKQNRNDVIYLSCIPFIDITSLVSPMKLNIFDSIPRMTWGKIIEMDKKYYLNISIQVNHSFVDGYHIQKFIRLIEEFNFE